MTKKEFLNKLKNNISFLPKQDIEDRLSFYSEMIDDKIEDGKSEEQAVLEIGDVEQISYQIIKDTPFIKIAKGKITSKRSLTDFEAVLLICTAPIWVSLLIVAFSVVISLYAALWAVIISLYACVFALAISGVGAVVYSVLLFITNSAVTGLSVLGAGLALCGVSILLYYFSALVSKGAIYLIKALSVLVKKAFIRREN